jgi:hypothetical protein
VDAYNSEKALYKEAQGLMNRESQISSTWRANQFALYSEKESLGLAERKKRLREVSEAEDLSQEDLTQEDLGQEETPRPRRRMKRNKKDDGVEGVELIAQSFAQLSNYFVDKGKRKEEAEKEVEVAREAEKEVVEVAREAAKEVVQEALQEVKNEVSNQIQGLEGRILEMLSRMQSSKSS